MGNFEVEGVKKVIESIIGVKQGDLLGPILFDIYGCAVMVAWRTCTAISFISILRFSEMGFTAARNTNR